MWHSSCDIWTEIIKNQRFDQKKDLITARRKKEFNSKLKVIDYQNKDQNKNDSYTGGRVVEYDKDKWHGVPDTNQTQSIGGGLLIRNRKKRTMKKRNV